MSRVNGPPVACQTVMQQMVAANALMRFAYQRRCAAASAPRPGAACHSAATRPVQGAARPPRSGHPPRPNGTTPLRHACDQAKGHLGLAHDHAEDEVRAEGAAGAGGRGRVRVAPAPAHRADRQTLRHAQAVPGTYPAGDPGCRRHRVPARACGALSRGIGAALGSRSDPQEAARTLGAVVVVWGKIRGQTATMPISISGRQRSPRHSARPRVCRQRAGWRMFL